MAAYFEAGMLVCFGISWPFAVLKTYRSKSVGGKSILFLWLIFLGYVSGATAKVLGEMTWVIALYALNGILVATDIALHYRYRGRTPEGEAAAAA
ncbi:MAG: hypothetical protein ACYTKD_17655 [Planctomycetota bacterium]|jgi:hypothetical protein